MVRSPDPYVGAVAVRAGLVLGALWLALPNIHRAPRWLLLGAAVLAAVIVVRPRLVVYSFPVAIAVALLGASRSGRGAAGRPPTKGRRSR